MTLDVVTEPFRLGDLTVKPGSNEIGARRIDCKAMSVLVCLAGAAPEVVTHAELLDRVWPDVVTGDNVLHQAIAQLRRALGDHARSPRFIETIPRRGYRLLIEPDAAAPPPGRSGLRIASATGGRARRSAASRLPVLAVLPFDDLSEDATLKYFSDGISEEILQTVSRTKRLKVIGRSSSFQFRGAEKSVRKVVSELRASHLLDGSVRRSGGRVRISAQLIDCASQTTLWSHRFEADLSDIFHLQDQIARAVAEALQLAFEPLAHATPIDPVGFDLYLRARTGAPTYVGAHDAGLLEAAVAREPRLAPAWAALALSWAIQAQESGMVKQPLPDSTVSHWRRRAEEAALRALDMDPDAALAHAALAALEPICGACAESRAHLMRALAATPDEPTALLRMGRWCFNIGRITDAMSFAGRAYDLDPLNPAVANDYGSTLYLLERRDEAHGIFEANRERWLETEYVVINPLSLATFWQEWDRVDRLLADLRARGPDTRFVSSQLLRLDALRHHPLRLGEELMTRLRKQLEATGTVSLSVAAQAGWLGSVDAVYPVLARASFSHLFDRGGRLPAGDYGVRWLFGSVHGPMQKDPRFVHLCARLGLCSHWVETDEWPDCAERLTGEYDFKAEARRALAAVSGGWG